MTPDKSDSDKRDKGVLQKDQNELLGKGFPFSGYDRDPLFLNPGQAVNGQVKYTEISDVAYSVCQRDAGIGAARAATVREFEALGRTQK